MHHLDVSVSRKEKEDEPCKSEEGIRFEAAVEQECQSAESGVGAVGRVMKLQKRAIGRSRDVSKSKSNVEHKADSRSNSMGSEGSRGSSCRDSETKPTTALSPDYPTTHQDTRGAADGATRLKSAGSIDRHIPVDTLPFELVKKPTKPLSVPLASQQPDLPILASTEGELIFNKLENLRRLKNGWTPKGNGAKSTSIHHMHYGILAPSDRK